MKILSLNMRHGGASRIEKIQLYIEEKQADIVVLPEFRNNKWGKMLALSLTSSSYFYYISQAITPVEFQNKNSVAVFSKVKLNAESLQGLKGGDTLRILKLSSHHFDIFPVYFANNQEKESLYEFLLAHIQNLTKPSLFIGDFNTGLHYEDETKATFYCEDKFKELSKKMVDIWRYFQGSLKESTWYSHAGNGFRIDHAFGNQSFVAKVKNCYYDHSPRENKISDHSAIIVELESY